MKSEEKEPQVSASERLDELLASLEARPEFKGISRKDLLHSIVVATMLHDEEEAKTHEP
jgi:hypothetical protein